MKAPCKDCSERHQACHGSCIKYKEFRAELDKSNKAREAYLSNRNFYSDVTKRIVA